MTNSQKPKSVFVQAFKRALLVDTVFMCVVYFTSTTHAQFIVDNVVMLLTLAICILWALHEALRAEHAQHEQWLATTNAAVHYPASSGFRNKVVDVEQERRRYRINECV